MPGVNFRLQLIAPPQQRGVAWRECADQCGKPAPKRLCSYAAAGDGFVVDKLV